jgi:hypothetical protein
MKNFSRDLISILVITIAIFPNIVLAYIDPGTGSMIISAIVFTIASIGYYSRILIQKIKDFFTSFRNK